MAAPALDCRKASSLLSAAYERGLTPEEREALRRHLALCLRCRNFEAQLEFLEKAARLFGERGAPDG